MDVNPSFPSMKMSFWYAKKRLDHLVKLLVDTLQLLPQRIVDPRQQGQHGPDALADVQQQLLVALRSSPVVRLNPGKTSTACVRKETLD